MVSEIWASPLAQQVKDPPAMQETVCKVGNKSSIPGLGRLPGEGNDNPLQYSCLGNPMDRAAWWAPWCCKGSGMT